MVLALKRIFLCALAACLHIVAFSAVDTKPPTAVAKTPAGGAVSVSNFEEFTLANGLRVIYFRRGIPANSPHYITTQMVYLAGLREQRAHSVPGAASMAAEMMFSGTAEFPDIDNFFTTLAGHSSGNVSWERTIFHSQLVWEEKRLNELFELEAARIRGLQYTQVNFDSARQKLIKRANAELTTPMAKIWPVMQRAVFADEVYGQSTNQELTAITALKLEDGKRFYDMFYRPDNAIFFISTDVPVEQIKMLAQKHLGSVTKPTTKLPATPIGDAKLSFVDSLPKTVEFDSDVWMSTIGFAVPGVRHSELPALLVAASLLADGDSVLKKSLTNGPNAISVRQTFHSPAIGDDKGILLFGVRVQKESELQDLEAKLRAAILTAAQGGSWSADDVKRAASAARVAIENALGSTYHSGQRLASFTTVDTNSWKFAFELLNAFDRVDLASVNSAVKKYLTAKPAIVRMQPPKAVKTTSK
jgi:predicted Zn-dependent peptidase